MPIHQCWALDGPQHAPTGPKLTSNKFAHSSIGRTLRKAHLEVFFVFGMAHAVLVMFETGKNTILLGAFGASSFMNGKNKSNHPTSSGSRFSLAGSTII
jgi:hypothetical protein